MKIVAKLVFATALVWLFTLISLIVISLSWPSNLPRPQSADVIICLGGDMSFSGWVDPGPASARRARTCAELQIAGVAPLIVFTGYGHERMSAAQAMANIAVFKGVSKSAVIVEPEARSTIQNAAFSLAIMPQNSRRIVLVSDAFHLPRSWAIFKLLGASEIALHSPQIDYSTDIHPKSRTYLEWMLRESVAIWANAARIFVFVVGGLVGYDEQTRVSWFN